jgi:hypothetical protein
MRITGKRNSGRAHQAGLRLQKYVVVADVPSCQSAALRVAACEEAGNVANHSDLPDAAGTNATNF